MYLTRIALDTSRRETMRALSSPGILHGAAESSFEGERARILWRIDVLNNSTYLLMLSSPRPDCAHLIQQLGYAGDSGETKQYDAFLANIQQGQRWRFRLRANPVKSASRADGRGKRFAHVTQEQQKQWLLERAQKHGFALNEDEFDVTDTRWEEFAKRAGEKQRVVIRTAAFEGLLTISDAELFKKALMEGIGHAKAYGCGLLTIIRE